VLNTESNNVAPSQLKSKIVNIIIADDHPLLRRALRDILETQTDFKVIAEANDGEDAIKLSIKMIPDVVIMDISMPKINGIEATRQIKAKCPNIAVLVLTVHDDNEHVLTILEAGAAGYLTKGVYDKEIINAIRSVSVGEIVLSPTVSNEIIKYAIRYKGKSTNICNNEKLTAKETEILRLAATGLSNKDIAIRLSLSLRTVKNYISHIFLKLGVASRTEATIVCLKDGILNINDINNNAYLPKH
jgi:DNA-binding NarL/FixJ family response regulator